MKTTTKFYSIFLAIFALAFGFLSCIFMGEPKSVSAETESAVSVYYFDQLSTSAKKYYRVLEKMRDNGDLKTGTATVDLIEEGVLENKYYSQEEIMSDFGAARDAFMLDNADLFYINYDNLTIRVLSNGSNYRITLGIGREDNYFADGITSSNVDAAISEFEEKVSDIVSQIDTTADLEEQVKTAYTLVIQSSIYALEKDAGDDADYVRTAYGVLVKGKGVCESFSRALKTILDRIGVTSVLVEGTYYDEATEEYQAHMWNYIQMDDNKWYMLDATMDNGLSEDAEEFTYFLRTNEVLDGLYQPNGIVSSSNYEFTYPTLSYTSYEQPNDAFTFELVESTGTTSEYIKISYNGMGARKAAEEGYYVIATFNVNDETNWFYVSRYMEYSYMMMQEETINFDDYDFDTYFSGIFFSKATYMLAVTTVAPEGTDGENVTSTSYIYCTSEALNEIQDKSEVVNSTTTGYRAPYATSVTPDAIRFYVGKTYEVTIVYNEDLMLSNSSVAPTLQLVSDALNYVDASTIYSDFSWSSSSPNTITFKFTPSSNYGADCCNYNFTVTNLVGKYSKLSPSYTSLYALNKVTYSCPVDPTSINVVYASAPALIAESDLSVSDWTYADGSSVGDSVSAKLSLVATEYTEAENAEAQDAVAEITEDEILSSKTYDLSLNLCSVQIAYLSNQKVKILVPFPDGYNASSIGVTFKAYHFTSSGEIEEIDCVVCSNGIVLYCDSFSAFTVAAFSGTSETKSIVAIADGYGTISNNGYLKLEEGGSGDLVITANAGYSISTIKVGSEYVEVENTQTQTLTFSYDDIDDGTVVYVTFAATSVIEAEMAEGYTVATSANKLDLTWMLILGGIVLVIACGAVAVVIISKKKKK